MHQIGTLVMNAQLEEQYVITAKEGHVAKVCRSKQQKQQENGETTKPDETTEIDTDNSTELMLYQNEKKTCNRQESSFYQENKKCRTRKRNHCGYLNNGPNNSI